MERLQERAASGAQLDPQQRAKVAQRPVILSAVAALEGGMPAEEVHGLLRAASAADEGLILAMPSAGKADGAHTSAAKAGAASSSSKKMKKGRRGSSTNLVALHASATAEDDTEQGPGLPAHAAVGSTPANPSGSSPPLGSSPPSCSMVPAFGAAGAAAADAEPSPTRQVGFASSSTSSWGGVRAEQPPSAGRGKDSRGKARKGEARVLGRCRSTGGLRVGCLRSSSAHLPCAAPLLAGALSMFLRGELEAASKGPPTPPPGPTAAPNASSRGTPSSTGPAWGKRPEGAAPSAASLKEILQEEAAGAATVRPAASPAPRTTPTSGAPPPTHMARCLCACVVP